MKVFHYDIEEGAIKGLIEERALVASLRNLGLVSCRFPHRSLKNTSWTCHTSAFDIHNQPVAYPHPVCFCLGQLRAGEEDLIWHWVVLLPTDVANETTPGKQVNKRVKAVSIKKPGKLDTSDIRSITPEKAFD